MESFQLCFALKQPGFQSAMVALESAYSSFPDALINDTYREVLKNGIIGKGTSYILGLSRVINGRPSTFGTGSHDIPLGFAVVLMLIDSYAPSSLVPRGNFDQRDAKIWLRNLDMIKL